MSLRRAVTLKLITTTDVHGHFIPYDFVNASSIRGSLARVYAYLHEERARMGDSQVILLEGGDILQGSPASYYANFIDDSDTHWVAEMLNFMRYDAAVIGNHDLETGHPAYDRWAAHCDFPVLAANVIDVRTGKPYFKPYTIVVREGVRIAVLGLTSPAAPYWLPEKLWEHLRFEEMVSSARKWMKIIREKETVHAVVGLFHSGGDGGIETSEFKESASCDVARLVPGFDVIFYGHDHKRRCETLMDCNGGIVHCVDSSSMAWCIGEAEMRFEFEGEKLIRKRVKAEIVELDSYAESDNLVQQFKRQFAKQFDQVELYASRVVGTLDRYIDTHDAYFGSSPFIDLLHDLQLRISGAEISFASPLLFDTALCQGAIKVRDMFNLYKFENMLSVIELTGQEIKDFLEMSYQLWTNRMVRPNDHILQLRTDRHRVWLANLAYNFDSAAGISYTVDVTQRNGCKISILKMADGSPFLLQKRYRVVTNSYRANGGGELLTKGAGIPHEKLNERLLYSSDKDLRTLFIEEIEKMGQVSPSALGQWHFVPEKWTESACERDRKLLFGT